MNGSKPQVGGVDAALGNAGVSDEVFSYTGRMALNAVCLFVAECSMLLLSLLAGGLLRWWWKGDPMFSSWMPLLLAAWLIGKRRAAGGYLAIGLFGWTIAGSFLSRQITFNAIYSLVAIAVIIRAADELNFKWRLPSPR